MKKYEEDLRNPFDRHSARRRLRKTLAVVALVVVSCLMFWSIRGLENFNWRDFPRGRSMQFVSLDFDDNDAISRLEWEQRFGVDVGRRSVGRFDETDCNKNGSIEWGEYFNHFMHTAPCADEENVNQVFQSIGPGLRICAENSPKDRDLNPVLRRIEVNRVSTYCTIIDEKRPINSIAAEACGVPASRLASFHQDSAAIQVEIKNSSDYSISTIAIDFTLQYDDQSRFHRIIKAVAVAPRTSRAFVIYAARRQNDTSATKRSIPVGILRCDPVFAYGW